MPNLLLTNRIRFGFNNMCANTHAPNLLLTNWFWFGFYKMYAKTHAPNLLLTNWFWFGVLQNVCKHTCIKSTTKKRV